MRLAALCALLLGACGGEEREAVAQREARSGLAASESTARRAASVPSTGLWTEENLLERLVRAGVAPRKMDGDPPSPEWMGRRPVAFHAGGGTVVAWIYPDSAARRIATDPLDPATAAPPGRTSPFAAPVTFVVQNNLAAVVFGGSERNQERVALALQAGQPVTVPAP